MRLSPYVYYITFLIIFSSFSCLPPISEKNKKTALNVAFLNFIYGGDGQGLKNATRFNDNVIQVKN